MSQDPGQARTNAGPIILAILSAAMFVYVIDTTVMNVSISALVEDLGTTVGGVQAAITLYTLTMASFMLTGGKLGDIWGSKRAFRIGLIVYGIGTTITALSQSLGMLIIGWSILEGLGSALIVPAINTLIRANYSGPRRASAYGVLWGVAAAGAAFGPLVGGWLTTNASWRLAFAIEAVIVVAVLAFSGMLRDAPPVIPKPRLDVVGVVLSVIGLGLTVLGVLSTSSRGWRDPLVWTMIVAGLLFVGVFIWWVRRREAAGQPALIHPSIFRHRSVNAGLPVLSTQTFAQAGLLFLIPLFMQSVLGFSAFDTGLTLLPLSIGVLVTSMTTPTLGQRIYPKYIIQGGLALLFVGGVILSRSLENATGGWDLAWGLLVGGIAIGLIAGQLPNLVLGGVDPNEASEASGLQGTAQNLGMALGTAVIGSVILSVGLFSIGNQVEDSTVIPEQDKTALNEAFDEALETANPEAFEDQLAQTSPEVQEEVATIYDDAVVDGFQAALLVGGFFALLGALVAFRLPKQKIEPEGQGVEQVVRDTVRNTTVPAFQLEMDDLARRE